MATSNTTHINITWAPPANPNGIVTYIVKVQDRDLLTGDTIMITMTVVREVELSVEHPVKPFSEYIVSVTSQTSAGMGEAVATSFQTPEQGTVCGSHKIYYKHPVPAFFFYFLAPSSAQNLTLTNNATYITITWAPPTTPNGIVNYTVEVQERDLLSSDICSITMQETSQLTLSVEYTVKPYSDYTVSVASQTSAGMAEAVTESFQTPEEGTCMLNVDKMRVIIIH